MEHLPAIAKPPVDGEIIAPDDRSIRVVACLRPFSTARTEHVFPAGSSLGEILREIEPDLRMRRYFAVSFDGGERIDPKLWDRIRVKGGNTLTIRAVPQGGGNKILRMVLMIAVTALAAAATWYIGGLGAPIAAAAVGAAIGIGGSVLGPTLIGSTKSPRRLECRCSR